MQKAWCFSEKIEANPSAGLPCFVTAATGLLWVSAVDIRMALDKQQGLETLREVLAKISAAEMDKVPSCILAPGDSIWCPLGYVPVVIAIGTETERQADDDLKFGSFTVLPVIGEKASKDVNPMVLAEVKAWLVNGIPRRLNVFKANGGPISKWMENWTVGEAVATCEFDGNSQRTEQMSFRQFSKCVLSRLVRPTPSPA